MMSSTNNQKLKTLYLLKILTEKTDEEHPMTVNDLIDELDRFGISAERKSVYSDVELLKIFGADIVCDKTRTNNYYMASREFELPELKLLVDAVQASKFITHKKSNELIKKIEKLTSAHEAKELHRHVIVNDRVKTMNESIYYNVDAIHYAIQQNRMVQFKYFDYTVDKRLKFRRNGEVYCVSPYALTWADDNYYLIAYHERYQDISHFRVDRMSEIMVSENMRPVISEFENFNVVEYSKRVFSMFSGETERVEIEFDNSLINVVIDRFGKDVRIYGKTETSFKIATEIAATGTFFGWLLMFGDKARIVAPQSLVDSMRGYLQNILQLYSKK
ncbi:Predicted DNA-binding transcriptional regulator YafY, contains an HTH and WYL domains [Anaerovirgula multivorans]|uniref:Predicted DNA-binding transcriptional regulator YafY, contains an HTH and WYL domains n=1 Tax=Anaerovirgula multivorans TaxID=312168 RepID=A0A239GL76_9FIRM|nr:WYL domain-containing protein [Anaerovirgula multivorans]SNS69917.1 Predicted DNA-binding transcriptional regulator YafY, contains an HTH and WYL domains [Anaerovirgula multivorans]